MQLVLLLCFFQLFKDKMLIIGEKLNEEDASGAIVRIGNSYFLLDETDLDDIYPLFTDNSETQRQNSSTQKLEKAKIPEEKAEKPSQGDDYNLQIPTEPSSTRGYSKNDTKQINAISQDSSGIDLLLREHLPGQHKSPDLTTKGSTVGMVTTDMKQEINVNDRKPRFPKSTSPVPQETTETTTDVTGYSKGTTPASATAPENTSSPSIESTSVSSLESTSVPLEETTSVPLEEFTSVPLEETTSVPLEETTSVPLEETTSVPLEEFTSVPLEETTSVPLEEFTSVPLEETTSVPLEETTSASLEESTSIPLIESTLDPLSETTSSSTTNPANISETALAANVTIPEGDNVTVSYPDNSTVTFHYQEKKPENDTTIVPGEKTNETSAETTTTSTLAQNGSDASTSSSPTVKGYESIIKDKCEYPADHIFCNLKEPAPECNIIYNNMSQDLQNKILDKHNQLRRQFAKGIDTNMKPAANMKKLVWDNELAASAQLWADQCTNKHLPFGFQKLNDSIKMNTENLYHISGSKSLDYSSLEKKLNKGIQAWYDEITLYESPNNEKFILLGPGTIHTYISRPLFGQTIS
ncbi:flocculation protein FLO11 isoform X2 [Eurytemora carolleeae]|uniref:flocculation protein FLO11 isoform X2 n=1 Tax=Eurytemora carolleeae TaxID=1294199 RepID=UPI000C762481|nr:flocculation protein FLO11 isoform X2 [Eurytemora carolleeae]XP_023344746.1 flocculation protein FLO11 isoform X2 [Eurytemora carolleeae]|eukprot:XP_023344745.1 flocculation protein FLO11-like isoform X2 [Eurytemora affinis]